MARIGRLLTGIILLGFIGAILYYITIVDNPYDPVVKQLQEEAERLDNEIASARSQAECEALAMRYLAKRLVDAQAPSATLGPDINELLMPREREPPPPPAREALKEMTDIMKRNIGAVGDGSLYLLACLRHLQDIGVKDMDESLGDIKDRMLHDLRQGG